MLNKLLERNGKHRKYLKSGLFYNYYYYDYIELDYYFYVWFFGDHFNVKYQKDKWFYDIECENY